MAGLLAARAVAEFYEKVTVVERDILPSDAADRRGVPQGRHLHALLARGAQVLDELFPEILDELITDGGSYFDGSDLSKLHYSVGGHRMVSAGSAEATAVYLASRPFLEHHVRRRVRATTNVRLLEGHDVVELMARPDCTRVTGARIVDRRSRQESILSADLVVDATGRGSRTPMWLESLGYARPVEDRVVVHLAYSSQRLQMRPGALHELGVLIGVVPGRPAGLGLISCENDTWLLTVMGMAGKVPPRELSAMCAFAEGFAPEHVLDAVRNAYPIGDVVGHRVPSSQWRRYDKLRRFPKGLLVIGDAICSFNPIYGQGMTVAALEALALRGCLCTGTSDLAWRFFRASARPIRQAWQLAAGGDLALPEIEGERSRVTRLFNGYVDRVLTAAEFDTAVLNQFTKVTSLVDPPNRLLRPSMLWRAASANHRRRRYDGQVSQPAPLADEVAV
nr:2-polyprenyl-6-methoxyphenol hydroxylase-like oxidoreductase [Mycobacterium kyorinense]